MFGTKDMFEYYECNHCGCLQIKSVPNNISEYYPPNYYSFKNVTSPPLYNFLQNIRIYFRKKRSNYIVEKKGLFGKLIYYFSDKYIENKICWDWFKKTGTNADSKILDVGCGNGSLLTFLDTQGFKDLTGIDPYINSMSDLVFGLKLNHKIYKKTIDKLEGNYDLIMLHHSLEHMENPFFVMNNINRLLKDGCYVLIRIPLADSYAWEKYRTDWVQLDAPRHLFIYTLKSFEIISKKTGFKIIDVVYDSTSFQFTGSELYLKNISLEYVSKKNGINSFFPEEEIKKFEKDADELNKLKKGDQACIFLKKLI